MKDYLPFIAVAFGAGFAAGVLVNIWALSTIP